jgi:hypothetical protein
MGHHARSGPISAKTMQHEKDMDQRPIIKQARTKRQMKQTYTNKQKAKQGNVCNLDNKHTDTELLMGQIYDVGRSDGLKFPRYTYQVS